MKHEAWLSGNEDLGFRTWERLNKHSKSNGKSEILFSLVINSPQPSVVQ